MTVKIGWIDEERKVYNITFQRNWTWQEFRSARKIASCVNRSLFKSPEDEGVTLIIDALHGQTIPSASNILMPVSEEEVEGTKRPSKMKAKGRISSDTVPVELLEEADWVCPVDSLVIVSAERYAEFIEKLLWPCYDWDDIKVVPSMVDALVYINEPIRLTMPVGLLSPQVAVAV